MDIKSKLNAKEIRTFFPVLGAICAIIAGLLFWHAKPAAPYLAGAAALCVIVPFVAWRLLVPVYYVWLLLAKTLGFINTHVLLFLAFYLLLTPVGVIKRFFSPDPLKTRMDDSKPTFWQPVKPQSREMQRYKKQF